MKPTVRHVDIRWSWGRSLYAIEFDNRSISVRQPSWAEQSKGHLFYLEWPPDSIIRATKVSPLHILVERDDRLVATIVPRYEKSTDYSHRRTVAVRIAQICVHSESYWLACDVIYNYCPCKFRIVSSNGTRLCYWKRTGGWGRGGLKMLISKCVDSAQEPIVVTAALATLVDTSDMAE